jgi:hypothetical protein
MREREHEMHTSTGRVQYVGDTTIIPTGDVQTAERRQRLDSRRHGIQDMARSGWRLVSSVTVPAESSVTIDDLFERVIPD